jgi:hypothetical protein
LTNLPSQAPPLFNFPIERIIPCSLHMMMAITKKLLHLLVFDLSTIAGKQAFLDLCAEKKLKTMEAKGRLYGQTRPHQHT